MDIFKKQGNAKYVIHHAYYVQDKRQCVKHAKQIRFYWLFI